MKVRLTSDQLGPNPKFDFKKPASESNSVNVIIPKGTEIEHPEALYFVINKQAEPVDEEAKQAWNRHQQKRAEKLNSTTRPAIITPPVPSESTQSASGKKTGK